MDNKLISAPQLAKLVGVHPDTIRDWEEFVPPIRTAGGHRRYRKDEALKQIAEHYHLEVQKTCPWCHRCLNCGGGGEEN